MPEEIIRITGAVVKAKELNFTKHVIAHIHRMTGGGGGGGGGGFDD